MRIRRVLWSRKGLSVRFREKGKAGKGLLSSPSRALVPSPFAFGPSGPQCSLALAGRKGHGQDRLFRSAAQKGSGLWERVFPVSL